MESSVSETMPSDYDDLGGVVNCFANRKEKLARKHKAAQKRRAELVEFQQDMG